MQLNYVEPENIKVNPDAIINSKQIGEKNHPVIVVDDFLLDPHKLISEYVEPTPIVLNTIDSNSLMPGWIGQVSNRFYEIDSAVTQLLDLYTDFDIPDEEIEDHIWNYQINVIHGGGKCARKCLQPHVDPAMMAFVLYLNEDDQQGGTGFYRHSEAGDMNLENVDKSFKRTSDYWKYKEWQFEKMRDNRDEYIDFDSGLMDDAWEEYHYEPMKFNRLILYPAYIFHSSIMKIDWYTESPRVSLSGFIDKSYFTE